MKMTGLDFSVTQILISKVYTLVCTCAEFKKGYTCSHIWFEIEGRLDVTVEALPQGRISVPMFKTPQLSIAVDLAEADQTTQYRTVIIKEPDVPNVEIGFVAPTAGRADLQQTILEWLQALWFANGNSIECKSAWHVKGKSAYEWAQAGYDRDSIMPLFDGDGMPSPWLLADYWRIFQSSSCHRCVLNGQVSL